MAASRGVAELWLSTALVLNGCAAPTALVGTGKIPLGRIQVTSATLGTIELAPAVCVSGEHQVFLGADFIDSARGTALRLVLEPTGEAMLRVFDTARPLDTGIVLRRGACSRFHISFERTGWRINDIYDVRVSVDVDCRTPAGDSVQGAASAAHCS